MRIRRSVLRLLPSSARTPARAWARARTVVPLVPRDTVPRAWNLWELERLAGQMNGDAAAEERGLLLLHMREFADASGDLPVEFDPLVRDAFGTGLAGLAR